MAYVAWSVVFGEQPSAAKWNILGTNDSSFNDGTGIALGSSSTLADMRDFCFRAYDSVGTTLTDGSPVQIDLATEEYDYNNNFAADAYTAPVAGVYHFDAGMVVSSSIASPVLGYIKLQKNGSDVVFGPRYNLVTNATFNLTCDILLAAGDVITLLGLQDSGGNEATLAGSEFTWFSGHIIRAT